MTCCTNVCEAADVAPRAGCQEGEREPLRVLLFSNLFPSAREPTRGLFNLQGFRALARYCEVRVVAPLPWWTRLSDPGAWLRVPRESAAGMEALFPTYWSLPRLPALHAAGMAHSVRGVVRRLFGAFPFDAVLSAWAYPDAVAAARLARELGRPHVTMALGSDLNELARVPALGRQIRRAYEDAARIVTVSAALRERVLELGIPAERIVVQHNGVDGERFVPTSRDEARARLGLPADRRLVTYVGNFKPEKGVDLLIEALACLRRAGRCDVEAILVGDGPLLAPLRERVRALGIEGVVRFCGRRRHEEIPDWIAAGDLFCLPSRREGCPNVVLEALASGRPVVATAVGGVPELLAAGNGVLAPAENPEALARAIAEALERRWEPDALRATVPCLSWDRFGRTLYEVLAAAVQAGAATR